MPLSDRTKKLLILAAEIGLVLAIAGIILATWLPALFGANPNIRGG